VLVPGKLLQVTLGGVSSNSDFLQILKPAEKKQKYVNRGRGGGRPFGGNPLSKKS